MPREDPGTTVCFRLTIDGQSLGDFNGCEGLSAQVDIEQREEGGNNGHVWQLPSRVRHSNVRLTRPLTKETVKVTAWISSISTGIKRPTAEIEALRLDGSVVARWKLLEVVPVSWTGPSLNPDSPSVATEVLEIAHHGFMG
ncbi:MAG: phage tail protein [Spirillospora sp.]